MPVQKIKRLFKRKPREKELVFVSLGLDSFNSEPVKGKIWCLSLFQISGTRFENDEGDNQARVCSGDTCVYAAPLLSELGAHYVCESIDLAQVLPAFKMLQCKKE